MVFACELNLWRSPLIRWVQPQVRERDEEEEGADLDAGAEDDEYVPLTPGGGLAPKKSWQRLIPGAPFSRNTAPDAPPLRQQLKDQARLL